MISTTSNGFLIKSTKLDNHNIIDIRKGVIKHIFNGNITDVKIPYEIQLVLLGAEIGYNLAKYKSNSTVIAEKELFSMKDEVLLDKIIDKLDRLDVKLDNKTDLLNEKIDALKDKSNDIDKRLSHIESTINAINNNTQNKKLLIRYPLIVSIITAIITTILTILGQFLSSKLITLHNLSLLK